MATYLPITSDCSQKDIFSPLQLFSDILFTENIFYYTISVLFKGLFLFFWKIEVLCEHHFAQKIKFTAGHRHFLLQDFPQKAAPPFPQLAWLSHLLNKRELTNQTLSHEILNVLSQFPGQKHCKRGCSCLMLVWQLPSWPAHWGLDQGSQTESMSGYSLEQRAEIPLLRGCNSSYLPWSAQSMWLTAYTCPWSVLVNLLISCNTGTFSSVPE